MNRALVEEYRAKARSERMAASAAIDGKAAQAASKLAHSYDQLADVHESVLRRARTSRWVAGCSLHRLCELKRAEEQPRRSLCCSWQRV
jgi:hypothetical protein